MNPILLPVTELKSALPGLGKVMRKRVTLPVLGCVRVQCTSANSVDLAVTDMDTTLMVSMQTPPHAGPASVLVPYNELCAIVKTCGPQDLIEVHGDGDKSLILKCPANGQLIEHRLETCPFDEYPTLPEFAEPTVVLSEALQHALQEAMECSSTDPTRHVINGAYLDVSRPNAHYVVGTDGRELFSSNSLILPLTQSLIVPNHKFLDWKGFTTDGEWKLHTKPWDEKEAGWFQISTQHWRFIARRLEGQYPDWRHVVPEPSSYQTFIEIDSDLMEAVVQTIHRLPCHSEEYHTLGLEVRPIHLRLMGRSRHDVPWMKVEVPVSSIRGAPVTIFVDRLRLLRAFRFGLTRIEIIDELSPLRLTDGASRQIIIMSLRPDGVDPAVSASPSPTPALSAPSGEVTFSSDKPFPPPSPAADSNPISTRTMPIYEDPPQTSTLTVAPESAPANGTLNGNGKGVDHPEAPEKPAIETALAYIETVKSGFREGINSLSRLSEMLKQSVCEQKASQREFQMVRQTLRSLQGVKI